MGARDFDRRAAAHFNFVVFKRGCCRVYGRVSRQPNGLARIFIIIRFGHAAKFYCDPSVYCHGDNIRFFFAQNGTQSIYEANARTDFPDDYALYVRHGGHQRFIACIRFFRGIRISDRHETSNSIDE